MGGYIQPNNSFNLNEAIALPRVGTELGNSYGNTTDYMKDLGYGATEMGGIDSAFDFGDMDMWKTGIGGVNSIMGLLGTLDAMKTNKIQRQGMKQNMQHAQMARDDRTSFLGDTKSAFQ